MINRSKRPRLRTITVTSTEFFEIKCIDVENHDWGEVTSKQKLGPVTFQDLKNQLVGDSKVSETSKVLRRVGGLCEALRRGKSFGKPIKAEARQSYYERLDFCLEWLRLRERSLTESAKKKYLQACNKMPEDLVSEFNARYKEVINGFGKKSIWKG